jgi:hypothetical protein
MKGQLSYIIKPLALVITIILLLLLYNSISSFGLREKVAQQSLDITADSTNILLLLANSPQCLAYVSQASQGEYANIVDVNKLTSFSQLYANKEPECARSFDYGWRATVTEFKQDNGQTVTGDSWSFGASSFSLDANNADNLNLNFSMPIAIYYSDKVTRPGKITIHLVSGELEKIAGIFDFACESHNQGSLQNLNVQIHTSYQMSYDPKTNMLCQVSNVNSCRVTDCSMDFAGFKSPGDFLVKINFNGSTEVVR